MSNGDFGRLLGQQFNTIHVSTDQQAIAFSWTNRWSPPKPIIFETDGDCCSETWFADIIGIENLVIPIGPQEFPQGLFINSVTLLDLPDEDNSPRTRQEHDQVYGVRLTTEKGYCDIIYRNSSNGYYSGDAFLSTKKFEDFEWEEITEDWSA